MYKLRISTKASRRIKEISKIHQDAILSALDEIKEDPFVGKPLTRELTGRYTYKLGAYRIIYKVNVKDKIVRVFNAEHRSVVYRRGRK